MRFNPISGTDPGLPDALTAHLGAMHSRALQLQIIATALEILLETGVADEKITRELASVVVGIAIEVQGGLDSVSIDRVLA
jgi:hypothetical protein